MAAGNQVTFSVTVNGTAPFTYQWNKGGAAIAGATGSTYTISATQTTDTGNYSVVVANSAGSTTSDIGALTVNAAVAPAITTQPVSQTVTAGNAVSFTAAASGSPTPTYQWKKGGVNISGATSATYTISSTVVGDAGSYTVVATNSAGSATSSAATLTVNAAAVAPAITTQPASQTVTAGNAVSFTVAASGSPTPTYQWKKGGVNIAGATSATYTISSTVIGDAGSYTVVATNSAGSATSSAATLTVNAATSAPVFTVQPSDQSALTGGTASFTATASGNPTPTYQWKKGGVNIAGATSTTFSIASVAAGDAGSYTVVATNSVGSVTSSAATLTITVATTPPAITTQPASQTVTTGNAVSLSVVASGSPSPTYQWKKGGVNIVGATTATYSIASAATTDAGSYTVVATNSAGSVTSAAATLTVNVATAAPQFTTQPSSQTVTAGGSASFVVSASGNPAPTFQWQKGGVNLAGATSATLTLSNVAAGDAGTYTAVATNSVGSVTSTGATLTVTAQATAPAFTTQPTSQTVAPGAAVSFTVAASGSPTPTYQWQKDGANVAGATSATFTIASVATGDAGSYTAVATNTAGSVTSSAATLTVSAATVAPTITSQPTNVSATAGSSASFSVVASGNPAPTYQWYFGGAAISGATGATLSLSNVQSANAGNYYVTVANSAGSVISATATLTVSAQSAATLVSGQFVAVGHEVAISALGAAGAIQWQVSTDGGATWQNISDGSSYSGTTSSTLEILNVSSAQNNTKYRVVTGGTASSATTLTVAQSYFTFPTSVGTDSAGNLYVSDAQLQTIQKISTSGQVTLVAGATGQSGSTSGNGSTARFNQPGALAAAPDGTLSVSDTSNDLVRSITTGGDVTTLAGSAGVAGTVDGTGAAARFSSPTGIARDSGSNLYVADSLNNTIRKITSAGVVSTLAGTAGTAGSADGTGTGASFKSPAGVAVDSAGNVYVSDTYNHTIRVIAAGGVVSTLAGQPGVSGTQDGTGSGARFNNPGGLAIGAAGEIYLADTGNSTIRKITPAGVVTTIAGLPGIAGLMDGTGAYAWFNQPDGLTLGADGNLYVADTGNALIRKVTLAGAVTTLPLATGATSGQTSGSTGSTGSTSGGSTTSAASGGGGGGGATSDWFALALAMICGLRCWQKKSVREGSNA